MFDLMLIKVKIATMIISAFSSILLRTKLVCFFFSLTESRQCRTPDNRNGNCVLLRECDSLFKLLSQNLSNEDRLFLRQSQCGIDFQNGFNPYVILQQKKQNQM